jgi:hypothetical protein
MKYLLIILLGLVLGGCGQNADEKLQAVYSTLQTEEEREQYTMAVNLAASLRGRLPTPEEVQSTLDGLAEVRRKNEREMAELMRDIEKETGPQTE